MSDQNDGGSPPNSTPLAKNAILCRCHLWGPNSMVMTVDAALRRDMGILPKDVIAFRVMNYQGRLIMVGEKVPLSALANLKGAPPEVFTRKQK